MEKRKEKLSSKDADKAVPYLLTADFTDAAGIMTFPKVRTTGSKVEGRDSEARGADARLPKSSCFGD